MKSNDRTSTGRAGKNIPRRWEMLTSSLFYVAVCIFVFAPEGADATIITTGDVEPGPPGVQADPWSVGLLNVALSSDGGMTIDGGSHVYSNSSYLGYASGANATLSITGPGSTLDTSGTITIGDSGTADATINSGGTISSGGNTFVGINSPGNTVIVEGASGGMDATMAVGGSLYLGGGTSGPSGGTADVTIGTGGTLTASAGTYVYHGSHLNIGQDNLTSNGVTLAGGSLSGNSSTSRLNLDHSGTVSGWGNIDVDVYMGSGGLIDGDLASWLQISGTLFGSGTIRKANLLESSLTSTLAIGDHFNGSSLAGSLIFDDVQVDPGTTLHFGIHGTSASAYDRLTLTGQDTIDGIAQISFLDGFIPDPSDTFQIIDAFSAESVAGWFGEVYAPSYWHLDNTGLLYYSVPEPSGLLIILFGCLLFCRRRRLPVEC